MPVSPKSQVLPKRAFRLSHIDAIYTLSLEEYLYRRSNTHSVGAATPYLPSDRTVLLNIKGMPHTDKYRRERNLCISIYIEEIPPYSVRKIMIAKNKKT